MAMARFPPAESPMVVMSCGAMPDAASAIERGHTVLELGRVAELGGASVVQHEADATPRALATWAASLRWLEAEPTANPPPCV